MKILSLLTMISPKLSVRVEFFHRFHRKINLKKPVTFNEKINYLKLFDYPKNNLVIQCTDKFAVREYVKSKKLGHILNSLYQVKESPDDIDFSTLPSDFVVKWNNDVGSSIICDTKTNEESIKKQLTNFGKKKFYLETSEMHYKKIQPRILVEKLLKSDFGLDDYKLYCYNGIPKFIMVCKGRQTGNVKFYFFDTNWNFLRINTDGKNAPKDFKLDKPECLDQMIYYAKILSKDFKFVRSDFYVVDGKPVFGELTFTPAAGYDGSLNYHLDNYLGSFIKI